MRHPQTAPNLGRIRFKSKNTVAEVCEQPAEPAFKQLRRLGVASITHEFHAALQFADGHRREIKWCVTRRRLFEEGDHPWVRRLLLAQLADNVCINQVHAAPRRHPRYVRSPRPSLRQELQPTLLPSAACAGGATR